MKRLLLFGSIFFMTLGLNAQYALLVDHTAARLAKLKSIPVSAITTAKTNLHIRYEHTSHGSQIPTGMDALDAFMGSKGIYTYANDVTGKLDLQDIYDCDLSACETSWVQITKDYLDNSANANCNVVMWSWCQIVGHDGGVNPGYCSKMESLITEYGANGTKIKDKSRTVPVQFVFMTGHVNADDGGATKVINDYIRSYCYTNHKILFDFADIESWNPDNVSFVDKNVGDDCSYVLSGKAGNWASEWVVGKVEMDGITDATHVESFGGQWFNCSPAHTHALNGNLKAYAAWYLFASLAGWTDAATSQKDISSNGIQFRIFPNPANKMIVVENVESNPVHLYISAINGVTVKEYLLDSRSSQIDVSDLPKGLYLCFIQSKNSSFKQKLIIQ